MNIFTVTFTNVAPFPNEPKQIVERDDLDMDVQRYNVLNYHRGCVIDITQNDYMATIATRDTHFKFLKIMLNDAQYFQLYRYGTNISTRSLMMTYEWISKKMYDKSSENYDHYGVCIKFMRMMRYYSPNPHKIVRVMIYQW